MHREFLLLLAISALATALSRNEASNNGTKDISKNYAPRFKHPSKLFDMDLKPVGSSIRLKCAAEGNPMPNITWLKNDGPIKRSTIQPSYGGWWVDLQELVKNDSGTYTCLVCNELGCISHSVNLAVQERIFAKPTMTKGPRNLTLSVGDTATFSCDFQSDPHRVYWLFYKTYEEYAMSQTSITSPDLSAHRMSDDPTDKSEQLTITNVSLADQGWYMCVAVNTLGSSTGEGYLTVLKSGPKHSMAEFATFHFIMNVLKTILYTSSAQN